MQILHKITLVIVVCNIAYSQGLKSPTEFDHPKLGTDINSEFSIPTIPLISIIKFYQEALSQIKGENCRMYPTCSHYGLEALQRYGMKGVLLATDRLHRCGHDLHFYSKVIVNNKIKYLDMVPKTSNYETNN